MNIKQLEAMLERESRITINTMLHWFKQMTEWHYTPEEQAKAKAIYTWLLVANDTQKAEALQWFKDYAAAEGAAGEQLEIPNFPFLNAHS